MGLAHIMKLLDQVDPPIRKIFVELFKLIEEQMVTKAEFRELRDVVWELAETQKRTEQRLNELAEAQRKTEQRVEELAEAQKRTEQRLSELTQRVNELAEAQKKTEKVITKILDDQRKMREQIGGLSHTVGYVLEDRAYLKLPVLLERDCGIRELDLKRQHVQVAPGK